MQADALAHKIARIRMSQVVKPDAFNANFLAHSMPELLDVAERFLRCVSGVEKRTLGIGFGLHGGEEGFRRSA